MDADRTLATLASIVADDPDSVRVLERHGLDYCCRGHQSLRDACDAAGLDLGLVLDDLAAAAATSCGEPEDWQGFEPTELVDHLVATHHAYLRDELPRLVALADKVAGAHGARHPEVLDVAHLVHALQDDLLPHLSKEEQILFPMIHELDHAAEAPTFHCGSLANPIRVMLLEHDRAGELLEQLRTTTDAFTPPPDACASYTALYRGLAQVTADTHLHVFKENTLLFPAVLHREQQLAQA